MSADEAFDRKPGDSTYFARAAEHAHAQILGWSEKELQDHVIDLAKRLGWLVYHTHDSRRSQPGFPDLVLVHPGRGLLFRELKTEKGRIRPEQATWLNWLGAASADAGIWRPRDWQDKTIQNELTRSRA